MKIIVLRACMWWERNVSRCTFDNNEKCMEWFGRLLKASSPPRQLEELFAFFHYVWSKEHGGEEMASKLENSRSLQSYFKSEVDRLKFDLHGVWRISSANQDYKLCSSYPPLLLVPSCITDETLDTVAKFRSSRRIPAVVWRYILHDSLSKDILWRFFSLLLLSKWGAFTLSMFFCSLLIEFPFGSMTSWDFLFLMRLASRFQGLQFIDFIYNPPLF